MPKMTTPLLITMRELCYELMTEKAELQTKNQRFAAHNPTWQRYIHDFNIPIDQS